MSEKKFEELIKVVDPENENRLLRQINDGKKITTVIISDYVDRWKTDDGSIPIVTQWRKDMLRLLEGRSIPSSTLSAPTPNRMFWICYEVCIIGRNCTNKPNTTGALYYGTNEAIVQDINAGMFHLLDIRSGSTGMNFKIADALNSVYSRLCRKVNALSIRYYKSTDDTYVYDTHGKLTDVKPLRSPAASDPKHRQR